MKIPRNLLSKLSHSHLEDLPVNNRLKVFTTVCDLCREMGRKSFLLQSSRGTFKYFDLYHKEQETFWSNLFHISQQSQAV